MLGELQDRILDLYRDDIPIRIIDDSMAMAEAYDFSAEKAAVYAVTGAYTMGRIEPEHLTPRGYEALIQGLNNMRDAAKNHQPDNEKLIASYDHAIADLQTCYEINKNPLRAFGDIWGAR